MFGLSQSFVSYPNLVIFSLLFLWMLRRTEKSEVEETINKKRTTNVFLPHSTRALRSVLREVLMWLKPVSTLSRDLVFGRVDTTTLYHVTAMLWYHVKHQYCWTRCSHYCDVKSYHGNRKALQKQAINGFNCSYLKNECNDSNFLLHKNNQQVKMKLSAKFKKMRAADSELP